MTKERIEQIVASGNMHLFYSSSEWRAVRKKALKEQHNECQRCKEKGKYRRATVGHHKKPVELFPELALSKDNIECLCRECHEKHHGRLKQSKFSNEELW